MLKQYRETVYENALRRRNGAGAAPPPFSPIDITGLKLWLDGADSSTITGTTSVTQWRDKSGTGYVATPSGTAANVNTLNSNKIVDLGGYVTVPSFNWRTRFTTFFIAKYSSAMLYTQYNGGYIQYLFTANGNLYNIDSSAFSVTDSATGGSITGNDWYILCMGYSGGTTAVPYSLNGTTRTTTVGGIASDKIITQPLTFSGRPDSSFAGSVAEILHYNEPLTTPQVQKVEGYLAWKWGLQANLPAGHPYKSGAP